MTVRNSHPRHRVTALTLLRKSAAALYLCAVLSSLFSAGYVAVSLASDGMDLLDVIVVGASGAAFLSFLILLHHVGIHVLPTLDGDQFVPTLKAWALMSVLVIGVSFPTGLMFIAEPVAKSAQFRAEVAAARQQAAEAVGLARAVADLQPAAESAAVAAAAMRTREAEAGAVSGLGRGRGIVTDTIATIAVTTLATRSAIIKARASTRPIVRRIEQLTAKIDQISDEPDMNVAEKASAAKGPIGELGLAVEALRQLTPISSIQSFIDGLSKDWVSIGLNDQAAGALRETFDPVARQFSIALTAILEKAERPIVRTTNASGFALLAKHMPAVFPIAVFVLLLDCLPLLIVFLVLTLYRRNEDDGSNDRLAGDPRALDSHHYAPSRRSRRKDARIAGFRSRVALPKPKRR